MTRHWWAWRWAIYALSFAAIGLAGWIHSSFGHPSIDQIMYHLRFGAGLVTDSGGAYAVTFLIECILVPSVLALLAVMTEGVLVRHWTRARSARLLRWIARPLPLLLLLLSAHGLSAQLAAPAYARSLFGKDFFSAHYVDPSTVELKRQQPKNLVLIYVEGMENSYGDTTLFGKDLLLGLRSLPGTTFDNYQPAPGTGWTMGGLVATQCGIPLKAMSLFGSARAGEEAAAFLPNAECLGDVLAGMGYKNVFLGGARLAFAGKGQFLADHGYAERFGKKEWLDLGATYGEMNDWGLYDDLLLDKAKAKLVELHKSGQLFNLTLLTLDTHHPNGFYSKRCRREGAATFEGIVECTANQVAEFVRFAQERGMLDDTRIVIVGDHLAAPNPAHASLKLAPRRTVFNAFISTDGPRKATDEIVPFDLYPSILQFIGIDVVGGRLGLGYAAFESQGAVRRSSQELAELLSDVNNPSSRYADLWRPHPLFTSSRAGLAR